MAYQKIIINIHLLTLILYLLYINAFAVIANFELKTNVEVSECTKKALGGNAAEQTKLGYCYWTKGLNLGHLSPKNELVFPRESVEYFKLAVKYLRSSAEQEEPTGQFWLGILYGNGNGVPRSRIESYAYINLAASNYPEYEQTRGSLFKDMPRSDIMLGQRCLLELQKEIEARIAAKGQIK